MDLRSYEDFQATMSPRRTVSPPATYCDGCLAAQLLRKSCLRWCLLLRSALPRLEQLLKHRRRAARGGACALHSALKTSLPQSPIAGRYLAAVLRLAAGPQQYRALTQLHLLQFDRRQSMLGSDRRPSTMGVLQRIKSTMTPRAKPASAAPSRQNSHDSMDSEVGSCC